MGLKWDILCGSLGRPHLPLLKWCPNPKILVEPQELELYQQANPHLQFHVLPESGKGFTYMMNRMLAYANELGLDYFVFTDDDVFGFKSRMSLEDNFKSIKGQDVLDKLSRSVEIMDKYNLAQMAISFSGQSWGAKKQFDEPAGSWGVYISSVKALRAVGGFDERLWLFSDWEMSARLIKAGYRVIRNNLLTFEHKMRGMGGGADWLYKNQAKVQEACQLIQTRYGEDTVRIKWVPKHGQHEIRFNWKNLTRSNSL